MRIALPYGKGTISADLPEDDVECILDSEVERYVPEGTEEELIACALQEPVGSLPLWELAQGKENVVIIASDHTRAVPSRLMIPAMLKEIYRGAPQARVTILIATGCHRGTSEKELRNKFGDELYETLEIKVHDCMSSDVVNLGTLPSGAPLEVDGIAARADLLVAEGLIEPHFFAGYSGGRKSVLPGVCSAKTVYANHCAALIADKNARSGILEGNPIHTDMVEGARRAGLAFILNVVCNSSKKIIGAFAGDPQAAHRAGCEFMGRMCRAGLPQRAPVVITSNNGYPLDQNVYQTVKSMCTAEAVCQEGGVIIVAASCVDGNGGNSFYQTFAGGRSPAEILEDILAVPITETVPDQWQSQILARIMKRHHVILVSQMPEAEIAAMGIIPAEDLEMAVKKARGLTNKSGGIVIIPDGVGTIAYIDER